MQQTNKVISTISTILLVLILTVSTALAVQINEGDLVFQAFDTSQGRAIKKATVSNYSHVGIVIYRKGLPYVFEASSKVRYTPLDEWTAKGEDGHYTVKRLKDAQHLLTGDALKKLRRIADEYNDKPYDHYFEWSDKRIYCSELVWKIYKRSLGIEVGKVQRLRDMDLSSPLVKSELKKRYGKRIPYNEKVISPEAVFKSEQLVSVEQ